MRTLKRILNHIFIDGLSGMAFGLFATLIVGTILTQLGSFVGGSVGNFLIITGKIASLLTGAGIGVGVACKFRSSQLTTISAAVAGMVGAYAAKILAGTLFVNGTFSITPPGEPLGAFIAAYTAILVGKLVSGKTKVDIIVTPVCCILAGSAACNH